MELQRINTTEIKKIISQCMAELKRREVKFTPVQIEKVTDGEFIEIPKE